LKFINGEGNSVGWAPSTNDINSGKGQYGTCCSEMDIWEANQAAAAYTPHPCSVTGQTRCTGNDCGDGSNRYGGVCDKDGCDFNSYRMGDKTFLGVGKVLYLFTRSPPAPFNPMPCPDYRHQVQDHRCDPVHHDRRHRQRRPQGDPPPLRPERQSLPEFILQPTRYYCRK
jgi:Glycosyl hydrolase family 7